MVRLRKSEKGAKKKKRKEERNRDFTKKKLFDIREMYFYDICKTETERKNEKKITTQFHASLASSSFTMVNSSFIRYYHQPSTPENIANKQGG